jgi:hypothetical protein
VAGYCREAPVERQQRRIDHLGERQVDRAICRDVLAQVPDSLQERLMRIAGDVERRKVVERSQRGWLTPSFCP